MIKRIIEEKPSLNELYHFGVKGMKWGVRKDKGSGSGARSKIISDTEKKIKVDVDRYGAMEASERISTYAYEDAGKIMRAELGGNDLSKFTREQKAPYADLESELLDRYDDFGYNYAESKRRK